MLGLTLVVAVLMSMGPLIGPTLAVLLLIQILAFKRMQAELPTGSSVSESPGLSCMAWLLIAILPFAIYASVVLVATWILLAFEQ